MKWKILKRKQQTNKQTSRTKSNRHRRTFSALDHYNDSCRGDEEKKVHFYSIPSHYRPLESFLLLHCQSVGFLPVDWHYNQQELEKKRGLGRREKKREREKEKERMPSDLKLVYLCPALSLFAQVRDKFVFSITKVVTFTCSLWALSHYKTNTYKQRHTHDTYKRLETIV